jgi:hypothetical protein
MTGSGRAAGGREHPSHIVLGGPDRGLCRRLEREQAAHAPAQPPQPALSGLQI